LKPVTLASLTEMVRGALHGEGHAFVSGFALDSRAVKQGDLFLAVKGASVDGHDFVDAARDLGAVATLAERSVPGNYILVPSLIGALANLGKAYRGSFQGPVVGITGSAGKTTTKEFVAAAVSPLGTVLKTQGNRNTEYTAPLTWAELEDDHKVAVIEMGMRGFHQIEHLAAISQPSVGLITNIGTSHIDLVGSLEGVAQAKGELFEALPKDGLAIMPSEDPFYAALKARSRAPVASFGFDSEATSWVLHFEALDWSKQVVMGTTRGKPWKAVVPAIGRHMALNAAAAILVAEHVGVSVQDAADALASATLPPLRSEILNLKGATIVLDAYNASPASMVAAIEMVASQPCEGRRLAVIGEMKELGPYSEEGHRSVGEALSQFNFDGAIFLGEDTKFSQDAATGVASRRAESLEDVTKFLEEIGPGDVALVKGSRAMELEKALQPLLDTEVGHV
jgi:UDP-N-acetylmuramoyl-tripeptide--D-alanyl-D-alanine ligase